MEESVIEEDEGQFGQWNDGAVEKFVCPENLGGINCYYTVIRLLGVGIFYSLSSPLRVGP